MSICGTLPEPGLLPARVFSQDLFRNLSGKILWLHQMPVLERIEIGVPDTCDDCRIILKIPTHFICRIHTIVDNDNRAVRCIAAHHNFSLFEQVLDILPVLSHRSQLFLRHGSVKIRSFWPEQGDKICCLTHTIECLPSADRRMGRAITVASDVSSSVSHPGLISFLVSDEKFLMVRTFH